MARLPGQVAADTARITVRSPGTYVGGVDPGRGLLRVHRLVPAPSRDVAMSQIGVGTVLLPPIVVLALLTTRF